MINKIHVDVTIIYKIGTHVYLVYKINNLFNNIFGK